jgi:hypothetical protein
MCDDYIVDYDYDCYGPNNKKNIYILEVILKDNIIKQFIEHSDDKYCKLILIKDKIKYNDLISFNLTINNEILCENENINNKIKNDKFYIEFNIIKKYIVCNCYIKKNIYKPIKLYTPPNY